MSPARPASAVEGPVSTQKSPAPQPNRPCVRFVAAQPFGGGFVRSYWPAGALKDLGFDTAADASWPSKTADVVVIHRPLGKGNLDRLLGYQRAGARVLISEDDDLTSLHQTKNPNADRYDLTYHYACISAADGIIVTTPRLEEVYGGVARESFLCPNYLPSWVGGCRTAHPTSWVPKAPRIGWAGVIESHLHDLEWLAPAAAQMAGGAIMSFVGDPRAARVLGLQRFESRGWQVRLHDLYRVMEDCDIGIVPLAPIEFNLGKSWLKALEYMTLGKPVVASKLPEQEALITHGSDGFLAETPGEFADYVQMLVHDPGLRQEMAVRARAKAAAVCLENMVDCWYDPLRLRVSVDASG